MSSRFEQDKETEARESLIASQTEAFQRFVETKHPEIHFCTALLNEIKAYMLNQFLTGDDADWEYAINMVDTRGVRQYVPTPDEVKASLIDEISSLIASANDGRDGKYDAHTLKQERAKMQHWTLPQLTQRLEEVQRRQVLSTKTATELRQIVQSAHKYTGYPKLGTSVVRPGTVRAVVLDAAYLRGLDVWELKKYCRLYGEAQVNARLRGE
jgi:hypothetical protein